MITQIFIKILEGDTLTIDIDDHATAGELVRIATDAIRKHLQKKYGYKESPAMEIYLGSVCYRYAAKTIPPDSTEPIGNLGIVTQCTVHQDRGLSPTNPYSYAKQFLEYEKTLDELEQFSVEAISSSKLLEISEISEKLIALKAGLSDNNSLLEVFQASFESLEKRLARFQTPVLQEEEKKHDKIEYKISPSIGKPSTSHKINRQTISEFLPLTDDIYIKLHQNDPIKLFSALLRLGAYLLKKYPNEGFETVKNKISLERNFYELQKDGLIRLGAMAAIARYYYSNRDEKYAMQGFQVPAEIARTYNAWKMGLVFCDELINRKKRDPYSKVNTKIETEITKYCDRVMQHADTIKDLSQYDSPPVLVRDAQLKEKFLKRILNKIDSVRARGGQYAKLASLWGVYFKFQEVDIADQGSIDDFLTYINNNLKNFETFDSTIGMIGAYIKQSFFPTPYVETVSDTRLFIGELSDFVQKNSRTLGR